MQHQLDQSAAPSDRDVLRFVVILSVICALILSILSTLLKEPQQKARELYRSEQMLVAARYLNPTTRGFIVEKNHHEVPAILKGNELVPVEEARRATPEEIITFYESHFLPLVVNDKGDIATFQDAHLDGGYIKEHEKTGYAHLPWKLIYQIIDPEKKGDERGVGWIIPINGFGLWDAIYGYLAIKADGITVQGISWYDQKETPGLGANITESYWQDQFHGKKIFQPDNSGKIDPIQAQIGITVVKGKVKDVYGDSAKSDSAVDGMTGATLTGNGVTNGYKDVLEAYRPFLVSIIKQKKKS